MNSRPGRMVAGVVAAFALTGGVIAMSQPAFAAGTADLLVIGNVPAEATAGDVVRYGASVFNNGPDVGEYTLIFTFTGPVGDASVAPGSFGPCTQPTPGTFECDGGGEQSPGQFGRGWFFDLEATGPGEIAVTATVVPDLGTTDLLPGNNTAIGTTTIAEARPKADLRVLTDFPAEAPQGDVVRYDASVFNNGPDAGEYTLIFTFTGPVGEASVAPGSFGTCTQPTPGTFECDGGGEHSPGQLGRGWLFDLEAAGPGEIDVTATVTPATNTTDPDPSNNAVSGATAITGAAADIAVTLEATAGTLLGSRIDYTVTASNRGPGDVESATVEIDLPTQVSSVTGLPAGCSFSSATDDVTCSTGPIANGDEFASDFRAHLGLLSIGPLPATATRTASSPDDTNPSNDSASADCTVLTSLIIACS